MARKNKKKADNTQLPIDDPNAEASIHAMLPQLLIILVMRMGGTIRIPAFEIDVVPIGKLLLIEFENNDLIFRVVDKPEVGGPNYPDDK